MTASPQPVDRTEQGKPKTKTGSGRLIYQLDRYAPLATRPAVNSDIIPISTSRRAGGLAPDLLLAELLQSIDMFNAAAAEVLAAPLAALDDEERRRRAMRGRAAQGPRPYC